MVPCRETLKGPRRPLRKRPSLPGRPGAPAIAYRADAGSGDAVAYKRRARVRVDWLAGKMAVLVHDPAGRTFLIVAAIWWHMDGEFAQLEEFVAKSIRGGIIMETIPVKASAKEALTLPFKHFGEFLRFSFWPMVIIWISMLVSVSLAVATGYAPFYLLWLLAYEIIAVPFRVSWMRLAILGVGSNTGRTWHTFGWKEFEFLLMLLMLLTVMPLFLAVLSALFLYIAYLMGGAAVSLILACVLLIAGCAVVTRFSFILPAIAVDSYVGLETAWKQTRSVVLRIIAVVFLSQLPIDFGWSILGQINQHLIETTSADQAPLLVFLGVVVFTAVGVLLLFLNAAVLAGAIAVCFRYRMDPALFVARQAVDVVGHT